MRTRLSALLFVHRCSACGDALPASSAVAICGRCLDALPPAVPPGASGCQRCGLALISEHRVCLRCRERSARFECNQSLWAYRGVTRHLIRAYKFDGRLQLAAWFASQLVARLSDGYADAVVPVPARPAGIRRRGYDHMALIGQHLRRKYGLPVVNALRRGRGREQKGLDYERRARNLVGKVWVRRHLNVRLSGVRVALIDDVFTTGATVDECASALLRAGARTVHAVTLARD